MKNFITIAALAVFTVAGFSSCSKGSCKTCTKAGTADQNICEDDYNNSSEYNSSVTALTNSGFTCNEE